MLIRFCVLNLTTQKLSINKNCQKTCRGFTLTMARNIDISNCQMKLDQQQRQDKRINSLLRINPLNLPEINQYHWPVKRNHSHVIWGKAIYPECSKVTNYWNRVRGICLNSWTIEKITQSYNYNGVSYSVSSEHYQTKIQLCKLVLVILTWITGPLNVGHTDLKLVWGHS